MQGGYAWRRLWPNSHATGAKTNTMPATVEASIFGCSNSNEYPNAKSTCVGPTTANRYG